MIPPTIPLDEPIVATAGVLLVHVPPPPSVKVIFEPPQTVVGPDIAAGNELTVIVRVEKHVVAGIV